MNATLTPAGRRLLIGVLVAGFSFLYAPIILVVLYSFNRSTSTTVWSGFSFRWYAELLQNDDVLRAARLSLEIATLSAIDASSRHPCRLCAVALRPLPHTCNLLAGMATAPLVMPEIVLAVSLLLLFVGSEKLTGWPHGRGVVTIILAHITYTAAFAAIVVQGRLAGIDRSIEEAAQDSGALRCRCSSSSRCR